MDGICHCFQIILEKKGNGHMVSHRACKSDLVLSYAS